jgi:hypothetical protein
LLKRWLSTPNVFNPWQELQEMLWLPDSMVSLKSRRPSSTFGWVIGFFSDGIEAGSGANAASCARFTSTGAAAVSAGGAGFSVLAQAQSAARLNVVKVTARIGIPPHCRMKDPSRGYTARWSQYVSEGMMRF